MCVGVRDIFHGVRQGIDTFDCVHPTRLGRHGGALVSAAFWDEEPLSGAVGSSSGSGEGVAGGEGEAGEAGGQGVAARARRAKMAARALRHEKHLLKLRQKQMPSSSSSPPVSPVAVFDNINTTTNGDAVKIKPPTPLRVREHVSMRRSQMRTDTRPIDLCCHCYTCRHFSRAYLHHLFRADEALGGTLVTLHNVHFMNKLMASIRKGIEDDTLDLVEKEYIHADLLKKQLGEEGIGV